MISITYLAVDGFTETRAFETHAEARTYAVHWIGAHPEIGRSYAISGDGIGRITAEGIAIHDLFEKETNQ